MITIRVIESDINRNEFTTTTETTDMNVLHKVIKDAFMPLSHIYIDNKPIRTFEQFSKGVSRQAFFTQVCDWVEDGIYAEIEINNTVIATYGASASAVKNF